MCCERKPKETMLQQMKVRTTDQPS